MSPTRRARLKRWITNPQTGRVVALSVLAAAVCAFVITSGVNERDAIRGANRANDTAQRALAARDSTAGNARRRLDLVYARQAVLEDKLDVANQLLGSANAAIDALRAQVEQQGGTPVANRPASTTTTTRPRPSSSTTSTTRPPSTTTTTRPPRGGTCLGPICIGG